MFEIRSYHYEPAKFEAYKKWAIEDAVPFLKANLDVVGFWVDNGREPILTGSDPAPGKHGIANITWIIRWESDAAREEAFEGVLAGEGWGAVWAKHPDADGYLQMEARFAEEL